MEKRLIMIDELGDEVIAETYTIGSDLDEDYLEIWQNMKLDKARECWPEARGFYFEDPPARIMHFDGYEAIEDTNYCPCCGRYYTDDDFDFEADMCFDCAEEYYENED